MDHDTAVSQHAAERYALGEMEPTEQDKFEEHFFSCDSCAGDVRTVSVFIANAREVFRGADEEAQPAVERARRGWFTFFKPSFVYGAVAACSLCLVAYQSLVLLPQLRAPQAFQATVLKGESRGTAAQVHARPGEPLVLRMDVNSAATPRDYSIEINSPGGTTVRQSPADARQVNLFIPATEVKPGAYTIVVRDAAAGRNGPELDRYRFEVQVP